MARLALVLALLAVAVALVAAEDPAPTPGPALLSSALRIAAARQRGESFKSFAAKYLSKPALDKGKNLVYNPHNPFRNAKNEHLVPDWPADVAELYVQVLRDTRYLRDVEHGRFPRRIAWLYPDDGCMVRAELFRMLAIESNLPQPAKAFSFGGLAVPSENAAPGETHVYWGWHVAPLVRIDGRLVVVDPAIDYSGMMALEEWLRVQTTNDEAGPLEGASICSGFAFDPESECFATEPEPMADVLALEQEEFLVEEWHRQEALGRDPRRVLGEHPPWRGRHRRPAGPAALLRGEARRS